MEGCKGVVLLVGMVLFLSGCAPFTRTSTSTPTPAPTADAPAPIVAVPTRRAPEAHAVADQRLEHLLAYAARSRSFGPEQLTAEYNELSKAERAHPSAEGRIRLALLLAHPHAPFRDDARARRLLRQAARAREGIGDLARLLHRAMEARMHLERALARERAQRKELQQKLEQLMTIEQEIDRRVPAPIVPQRQ